MYKIYLHTTHPHTHISTHTCTCTNISNTHMHTHKHIYTHMHIHKYIYTHMHIRKYIYTHTPVPTYMDLHSYTFTRAHTHAHAHTHTHTHTAKWLWSAGRLWCPRRLPSGSASERRFLPSATGRLWSSTGCVRGSTPRCVWWCAWWCLRQWLRCCASAWRWSVRCCAWSVWCPGSGWRTPVGFPVQGAEAGQQGRAVQVRPVPHPARWHGHEQGRVGVGLLCGSDGGGADGGGCVLASVRCRPSCSHSLRV
jgi:hypothetical protein